MKRTVSVVIVIIFAWGGLAHAKKGGNFGLGVILGEPTGISLKWKLGGNTAIDGGLAWSFGVFNGVHAHADFLWHPGVLSKIESHPLSWYLGIGGKVQFFSARVNPSGSTSGGVGLAVRVPFGLVLDLNTAPLDFFIEVVPGLALFPATAFDFAGGIGCRYYF